MQNPSVVGATDGTHIFIKAPILSPLLFLELSSLFRLSSSKNVKWLCLYLTALILRIDRFWGTDIKQIKRCAVPEISKAGPRQYNKNLVKTGRELTHYPHVFSNFSIFPLFVKRKQFIVTVLFQFLYYQLQPVGTPGFS